MEAPASSIVTMPAIKADVSRNQTRASLLVPVDPSKQIVVTYKDLCAHVPILVTPGADSSAVAPTPTPGATPKEGGMKKNRSFGSLLPIVNSDAEHAPKERQVLFNVTGECHPGTMMALMGPSGSGKSSLLSVLGGRSTARISGSMLFNGKPLDKPIKRTMGFVTQDDLLYGELTTFETLYYAALLRLPRSWTRAQKVERVEMVLEGLGLSKCRDTIIGNHMMRGVSGGERKRVSIGHELLINPSVIFLDEPTSGLDSTTALKLIHTLRSLASGGRTIIASIHQPSSRLYQEIDQLTLLAEGRVMYYGEAHASALWFARQGMPVPFGVSIPDHLLDLACGDLPNHTSFDSTEIMHRLLTAYEQRDIGKGRHGIQPADFTTTSSPEAKAPDSPTVTNPLYVHDDISGSERPGSHNSLQSTAVPSEHHVEVKVVPAPAQDASAQVFVGGRTAPASTPAAPEGKWGATFVQQVRILTERCVRVRRFQALSIQRFAEVLIVAVLAGLFWFQVGGSSTLTPTSIRDINGLLFFQVLFMSFSSMFQAIFAFPADFQMLIKERQSGMYRLTAYYAARTLSDIPMDCLVPTLFCWIIYWMSGLRISAGAFFGNWFSMLLTMLVAQSLGLLIGATIMNPKTALAFATVSMLCIMLVGGYYVQSIPVWISWLKYVSFIFYGYNLLIKIEYHGRGYDCADYYAAHPTAPPGQTWCSVNDSGLLPVDVNQTAALESCVLIGMLLVVRLAVYLALRSKTTFKTKKVKAE